MQDDGQCPRYQLMSIKNPTNLTQNMRNIYDTPNYSTSVPPALLLNSSFDKPFYTFTLVSNARESWQQWGMFLSEHFSLPCQL